jgi:hypothetical protein
MLKDPTSIWNRLPISKQYNLLRLGSAVSKRDQLSRIIHEKESAAKQQRKFLDDAEAKRTTAETLRAKHVSRLEERIGKKLAPIEERATNLRSRAAELEDHIGRYETAVMELREKLEAIDGYIANNPQQGESQRKQMRDIRDRLDVHLRRVEKSLDEKLVQRSRCDANLKRCDRAKDALTIIRDDTAQEYARATSQADPHEAANPEQEGESLLAKITRLLEGEVDSFSGTQFDRFAKMIFKQVDGKPFDYKKLIAWWQEGKALTAEATNVPDNFDDPEKSHSMEQWRTFFADLRRVNPKFGALLRESGFKTEKEALERLTLFVATSK